jgi:hypothetical protein
MLALHEGDLPTGAGFVHRNSRRFEMRAKYGLRIVERAASTFLPGCDTGSQITGHRLQPVLLIGEKLADMDIGIGMLLPKSGRDSPIGSSAQSGHSCSISTRSPTPSLIDS